MGVRGPPAGVRVGSEPKIRDWPAWVEAVGRVDTWYSLSMHGCPTMRVALAAASSRQPADTTRSFLGVGLYRR
jgi:hypothetical protein